ncbi:mitogen-activated protein kinase kinase kinase NPK1 [Amborella trichopoda]|uniref:Protein kinase domain-containing protein n=1 Tax=Amborella trichopoda TaxID=13333 RepID=W1NVR4_AMBTC|nr:mitogen-activated protein kinase kinase kinase NPK1 [Amborella trichopoda]ERM99687.1 hypothetical protein AMTR_s00099p00063540 [Amborella trichopoda]|eukprot:XP_006836834.1 mitogen-activated protein kinase kinase kinase NPK1 [Amborella trichopoda]
MGPKKPISWVRGKPIGSGSFGIVSLAMDKSTGELFVVKSADESLSKPSFEVLQNESHILLGIDSPHIVRRLGDDFSEIDGSKRGNLFMEYMAGGNLAEILGNFGGSLAEPVIRSYTREILKGLSYLHENQIVHGDLKCKNVLFGPCGKIKLGDFGCAKKINKGKTIERGFTVEGTPLFMAPEVLRREELGFGCDIWALGCTVIEMATGKPAWSGGHEVDPMAAIYRIAFSRDFPEFPARFSREGRDFLRRCFERDPRERWGCEQLLAHPFLSGREIGDAEFGSPMRWGEGLELPIFRGEGVGSPRRQEEGDLQPNGLPILEGVRRKIDGSGSANLNGFGSPGRKTESFGSPTSILDVDFCKWNENDDDEEGCTDKDEGYRDMDLLRRMLALRTGHMKGVENDEFFNSSPRWLMVRSNGGS